MKQESNHPEMKKLGFGFMRLPITDPNDRSTVDIELTKKMVDLYMSKGFTYFDTARRYNDEASEPAIREALTKRYPRDSYVLTDKITVFHNYIHSEEEQEPFFKKQLEICSVEYFDNYLIHNMGSMFYPVAQKFRTFEFIKRMKGEGYCKRIGISFHDKADVLDKILTEHPELDIEQIQLNYLDWDDNTIQSRLCYETARKHGKQVVVMEPVKGGTLMNLPDDVQSFLREADLHASLASWAIRFAASHEGVLTVLSGMSTLEQVEDNTSYMQEFKPMTDEEFKLMKNATEMLCAHDSIACTFCRYCTSECPKQIAIPDYFELYNNMKRLKTRLT